MYFAKINTSGSGLTNQLFSLISSIMIAYQEKHKVVIVDHFLNDISKNTYTPISHIFDIEKINIFLKENYDIIILDKYNINFEIISFQYGTKDNKMDITHDIVENCLYENKKKNNIIYINKSICFTNVHGDPYPHLIKNLFFNYKINGYFIEEIFDENREHNILIDFLNSNYIFNLKWIDFLDVTMFENILVNIHYYHDFIEKSTFLLKDMNMDLNKKINIIHLRLEDDAINHWSMMNQMTHDDFKNYIEKKYINLIENYISKTDETIILSSSLSNKVVDFLIENQYSFKFNQKFFEDREKNAIVDLLTAKYCNHIFIGNFNIKNLNGSTFSYYIGKCIQHNVKKIYIDLDHILDVPVII